MIIMQLIMCKNKNEILPPSSLIRKTKYLLESMTASTAIPGYCSTGHLANNSPEIVEYYMYIFIMIRLY